MTTTQTKFFLFEIRESDGNDCSVFDCIVEAESRDKAQEIVGSHFDEIAKSKGWESDGGWGYYFPCDCESPEEPTDDPSECEQCEVLSINGVPCHEQGCPTLAQYKRDLKAFERFDDRDCSHGGLTISEQPEEFETEEEADKIAHATIRGTHCKEPSQMTKQEQLSQEYSKVRAADEAFQAAVIKQFGRKNAGTMRYVSGAHNAQTKAACDAYHVAANEWITFIRQRGTVA